MKAVEFTLPFPPSVNHYWRRAGTTTHISRAGKEFRQNVQAILLSLRVRRMLGPLDVEVVLHPPDRRRRDLDNSLKALLDAMQHGGAYEDDSQIERLTISRADRLAGGKAVVRIQPME